MYPLQVLPSPCSLLSKLHPSRLDPPGFELKSLIFFKKKKQQFCQDGDHGNIKSIGY